jgi:hypothetical protein
MVDGKTYSLEQFRNSNSYWASFNQDVLPITTLTGKIIGLLVHPEVTFRSEMLEKH